MNKQKSYLVLLFSAFIITWLFSITACKDTGHVEIYSIGDTIQNCSVPYIVKFGADFETGSGDYSVNWDFGDGETSTEDAPVHIYREPGVYKVSVMIKQREASASKSIGIDLSQPSQRVEAAFEADALNGNLHAPANLLFFNYSKYATSYKWYVNNQLISTKREPEYVFEKQGNYIVKLEASCNGDTAFFARQVDVTYPPTDMFIRTVSVTMPSTYIGSEIQCVIRYDIFNEESSVWVRGVRTFPVTWEWNPPAELFFFNGSFTNEHVEFLIFEVGKTAPAYVFSFNVNDWQNDFYPRELVWPSHNGFSAVVRLDYK